MNRILKTAVAFFLLLSCHQLSAEEQHLKNIKQLTFGGENAEAYFSSDGRQLIFQSTRNNYPCDQIYIMNVDGTGVRQVSTVGRTTCGYFYPDGKQVFYSSTHATSPECPAGPDRTRGYVWPLYQSYDIYRTIPGSLKLQPLASSPGYDAEATISPDGARIVFTSDRDGDLELYVMNSGGSNIRRLTNSPGYDGGAFFSPDSNQIVYRAHPISDENELSEYRDLLKQHLVRPTKLEIYVMNADGSNSRQVTNNGKANFCPFFHPDGKRIIFASNMHDPTGRNFDLYLIGTDGTNLKQITDNLTFDGFPMFSPDGTKLVFASNRNAKAKGETNIFIADWIDSPAKPATSSSEISMERLQHHVEALAADEMKGRLAGTEESNKAAEYIANEFKQYGLMPPEASQTYFQEFEFSSGVKAGTKNSFNAQTQTGNIQYTLEKDFIPAGFSDDAAFHNLPVVFAGYGIKASALNHDDYSNLDVKGKAVIVLRYGPEGDDPKSQFAQYYSLRYKAMTAREAGASVLLIVTESDSDLPKLRLDRNPGTAGLAVLHLKRDIIAGWFDSAKKKFSDPKNQHQTLATFEIPGIQVSLQTELIREKAKSQNVLGWVTAPAKTDQTLVIGAHYDHLGTGIEGSLAPKSGEVHNGADDNASGTAAVLELARTLSPNRNVLNRNVLFVAFGAEELGVLGSSYFVKNPVIPLKHIVAMFNLDMVGRLRDGKLIVGGVGTSPSWKEMLLNAEPQTLKLTFHEDGYGPSDHFMFYAKDIPVLFFFTGAHAEYHRPEDDPKTLNYSGLGEITQYVYRVLTQFQKHSDALKFTRVKSSSRESASRGFRVYLGTIPDYSEETKGVKLSGVRDGSPAEKAGIQPDDVIVEFAGKKVENIYDYTYAMQDVKPGQSTKIVVLRNGNRIELEVIPEKRSE